MILNDCIGEIIDFFQITVDAMFNTRSFKLGYITCCRIQLADGHSI